MYCNLFYCIDITNIGEDSASLQEQRRKLTVVSDNNLVEGIEGVNIDENTQVSRKYLIIKNNLLKLYIIW